MPILWARAILVVPPPPPAPPHVARSLVKMSELPESEFQLCSSVFLHLHTNARVNETKNWRPLTVRHSCVCTVNSKQKVRCEPSVEPAKIRAGSLAGGWKRKFVSLGWVGSSCLCLPHTKNNSALRRAEPPGPAVCLGKGRQHSLPLQATSCGRWRTLSRWCRCGGSAPRSVRCRPAPCRHPRWRR